MYYMKIQKNENGKGKRQIGFKRDSYGAVGHSQSHWYLGLELHEILVFGIESLWKLGRKKVKDPFSRMAFYDLSFGMLNGTFPHKAWNPITWR